MGLPDPWETLQEELKYLDSLRRRAEMNYFMQVTGTHSGGNDGTSIRD